MSCQTIDGSLTESHSRGGASVETTRPQTNTTGTIHPAGNASVSGHYLTGTVEARRPAAQMREPSRAAGGFSASARMSSMAGFSPRPISATTETVRPLAGMSETVRDAGMMLENPREASAGVCRTYDFTMQSPTSFIITFVGDDMVTFAGDNLALM